MSQPETFIGDKDLFERNLAALEKRQPAYAARMRKIVTPGSRIVKMPSGGLNLDLGHSLFYEEDAERYLDRQMSKYLTKPDRVFIGWVDRIEKPRYVAEKMYEAAWDWLLEQGLEKGGRQVDPDGGFVVVLGIGLGLHVGRLIEELDVRMLVISEQFDEFLYHAMHLHDLSEWYETLEGRGGNLVFILGDDPTHVTNLIYGHIKNSAFGLADGSYFYVHYNSYVMREVERQFIDRVPIISGSPGFFEDELVMMENCFRNITGYEAQTFNDKGRILKQTPVFIIGSGPSLDDAVDQIRALRDQVILVTCGTGLGTMLNYGFKPDFHVELENTPGPLEIITGLSKKYDLGGITLIASNTVHPEVPAFFDRRILYFRDSVTSTKMFGQGYSEVFNAAPTVTNVGSRITLGMGFRTLYLFGVDFGTRVADRHHSEQSVYDEDFLKTHPDHKKASQYDLKARGNFGGVIHTSRSFLSASIFFSTLQASFPEARLINCSDGIRIPGTIPQLPESLEIVEGVSHRDREMRLILEEYEREKGHVPVSVQDLEILHYRLHAFYAKLREALPQLEQGKAGLYRFYDQLQSLVYAKSQDPVDQVVEQFHVGSLMQLFQVGYIVLRRVPEETRDSFMTHYARAYGALVEEMAERALTFTENLIEEARKVA
ncbi:motility associated factor glycosyltransferase family protein [Aestuariispira insulae]|uniref:Uncharacterized protein DUF115 n=1 Tax=Aestuariispira insulae TaxID=1461337 RepID=A0A3D9HSF6_9PROT|nr:6-hydroxymethylpterin diphosphokinase MptE-like protein [Aestuariispira insulae]RED52438.1 uncharacterized protein DUF115 [Aestuariispira insulae]